MRVPAKAEPVWHLFPVLVRGDRAAFQAHLRELGVDSAVHYPGLISEQRALLDYGRFHVEGSLDRAADFTRREVSLPIHPYLSETDVGQVIAACNAWTGG